VLSLVPTDVIIYRVFKPTYVIPYVMQDGNSMRERDETKRVTVTKAEIKNRFVSPNATDPPKSARPKKIYCHFEKIFYFIFLTKKKPPAQKRYGMTVPTAARWRRPAQLIESNKSSR